MDVENVSSGDTTGSLTLVQKASGGHGAAGGPGGPREAAFRRARPLPRSSFSRMHWADRPQLRRPEPARSRPAVTQRRSRTARTRPARCGSSRAPRPARETDWRRTGATRWQRRLPRRPVTVTRWSLAVSSRRLGSGSPLPSAARRSAASAVRAESTSASVAARAADRPAAQPVTRRYPSSIPQSAETVEPPRYSRDYLRAPSAARAVTRARPPRQPEAGSLR